MSNKYSPKVINKIFDGTKPMAGRAFSLAATFVLSIIVARNLSISDTGKFFFFFTTVFALSTFGRLGVENLALKLGNSNEIIHKEKLKASLILAIILSVFTSIALFLYLVFSGLDIESVSLVVKIAVSASVFSVSIYIICSSLLRARGYFSSGSFLELGIVPTVTSVLILLLNSMGNLNLGNALLAFSSSTWIAASYSIYFLLKHFEDLPARNIRRYVSDKRHLFSLTNTMFSNLLYFGVTWAPLFLLSLAGNEESAALYYVAIRFANIVALLPTIQSSHLGPIFADLLREDQIKKLNIVSRTSSNRVSVVGFVISLGIVLLSWSLIPYLYGAHFKDAIPATIALTFGTLIVNSFGQVTLLMILSGLEALSVWLLVGTSTIWIIAGGITATHNNVMMITAITLTTSILYSIVSSILLVKQKGIKSYARLSH